MNLSSEGAAIQDRGKGPIFVVVLWSKEDNLPILVTDTSIETSFPKVAYDIRPVFPQEKRLLEVLLELDEGQLRKSSVWATNGNRLIIDGQLVPLNKSEFIKRNVTDIRAAIRTYTVSPDEEKNHSDLLHRFAEKNSDRLKKIEYEAFNIIEKARNSWPEQTPVVSFSGGKDSTVVSHLVRRKYERQDIMHVFGNTTLELPTTYDYIKRFRRENSNTPFREAKSSHDFTDLCKRIGPPSRVMRWCCTIFKTGPISKRLKAFGAGNILTYYGIRHSESSIRSTYQPITTSPKASIQTVVSPIIDWRDADVWLYLATYQLDFNDAYKLGFSRVGCWCCPSNSKWSFFLMRIYYPEFAEPWRDLLIEFARSMGKPDPEVYVDSGSWKARQGGVGVPVAQSALVSFRPCGEDPNARWYELTKPVDYTLYEYFKPFGKLDFSRNNPVNHNVLVLDKKTGEPIISLEAVVGSSQIRVAILKSNDPRLLQLRIDCQLRKFQSCILCGGCPSICPSNAISDTDGRYRIDDTKCTNCLKCVNHFDTGCLVSKVLQVKKART